MTISLKTPLVLVTDDDFARVSSDNPGYTFERDRDGAILVSPTHTLGGAKSLEAAVQLYAYAKRAGGKAFDSNTGFAIGPGQRIFAPDAAWVAPERIAALTAVESEGYWPLSPDVVIEVRSPSDRFTETKAKLEIYLERGTRYAVALDPETREIAELGERPGDLGLDFDAILDA